MPPFFTGLHSYGRGMPLCRYVISLTFILQAIFMALDGLPDYRADIYDNNNTPLIYDEIATYSSYGLYVTTNYFINGHTPRADTAFCNARHYIAAAMLTHTIIADGLFARSSLIMAANKIFSFSFHTTQYALRLII